MEGGVKMTIGENIRKYRKEKGLTQKALGKLCGINEANIRKYEINPNITPQLKTIEKIADALEVTITDLMGMSEYLDEVKNEIHQTTNFLDYLGSLGYEVGQGEYSDYQMHIKKSNTYIELSSEDIELLENSTKTTIDNTIKLLIAAKKQ